MIKVKDLAEEVGMDPKEVIKELKKAGIMVFSVDSVIQDSLLPKAKSHLEILKKIKIEEELKKQREASRKKAISRKKISRKNKAKLKEKKKAEKQAKEEAAAAEGDLKIRKIKKIDIEKEKVKTEVEEKEKEKEIKKEPVLQDVKVEEEKKVEVKEKVEVKKGIKISSEKGKEKEKGKEVSGKGAKEKKENIEKAEEVEKVEKTGKKEVEKEKLKEVTEEKEEKEKFEKKGEFGRAGKRDKFKRDKYKKDYYKTRRDKKTATISQSERDGRKKSFKKEEERKREKVKVEDKSVEKKEKFEPIVIEIDNQKRRRRGEILKSTSTRDSYLEREEKREKNIFSVLETSKKKKKKKKRKKEKAQIEEVVEEIKDLKKVTVTEGVNVKELSEVIGVSANEILKVLFSNGYLVKINDILNDSHLELIGKKFGFDIEVTPYEEDMFEMDILESDSSELLPRPPIVTVMGHVDHGKTTLLDAIRESKVVEQEAGKITQHIGAYTVRKNGRDITFIDTPGHEAFTMMRARGAKLTDIVVLVVAADDGVKEQTVEAIHHAKAAGVPIIVAINKIDLPNANPDRVKQELAKYDLVPEEWGGNTIFVEISAKKRQNIDELLEMILLSADMLELVANPKSSAYGTVIEAKLDPSRGAVATLLVQNGTLREKDFVVVGYITGKIRAMFDDSGKKISEAGPSTPVEVLGLEEVPIAGDKFFATNDHLKAKKLSEYRKNKIMAERQAKQHAKLSLENIFDRMQEGEVKELPIILKVDVNGSKEAIENLLSKMESEKVKVKIIYSAVGAITDNDVMLASASNAIIVGFNVKPTSTAEKLAKQENVDIRFYRVIYNIEKDIKSAMAGLLEPEEKEKYLGKVEVRKVFKVPRVGTVAGCYVTDGVVTRNANCRIIRDGIVIYEGKIASLKRFKQDVPEVKAGFECGIGIEKYNDIKEGDVLEIFTIEQVEQELE